MPSDEEYSVHRDPIARLLQENHFDVPTFQRPYVWGREEIDDLIYDLAEFLESDQNNYFLGLISLESSSSQSQTTSRQNIIDGQQRLISFTLLCSALYRLITARGYNPSRQSWISSRLALAQACRDDEGRARIRFYEEDAQQLYEQLMDVDTPVDMTILSGESDETPTNSEDAEDEDELLGRTRDTLKKAYDIFEDGVQILFPNERVEEATVWPEIRKLVNNVLVAFLRLPPNQEALMVFQRMNNRGRQLSEDEKVKTVFAVAADGQSSILQTINDCWIDSTNNIARIQKRRLRLLSNILTALGEVELELIEQESPRGQSNDNSAPIRTRPQAPRDLSANWQKILTHETGPRSTQDFIQFHLVNIKKGSFLISNLSRGIINNAERRAVTPQAQRALVLHASRRLGAVQQMPLALMANVRLGWSSEGQKALMWALDRRVLLSLLARERSQALEAEFDSWIKKISLNHHSDISHEREILQECIGLVDATVIGQAQDQVKHWTWETKSHRNRIRALLASIYFDSFTAIERRSCVHSLEDLMKSNTLQLDHIYPKSLATDRNKNWIHTIGNLTILETVPNHQQSNSLPISNEKLDALRSSQVGGENQKIADQIERAQTWGRQEVNQRTREIESRLEQFFNRGIPDYAFTLP